MFTRRALLESLAMTAIAIAPAQAVAKDTFPLIVRDNRLFLDIVVNGHNARALLDSAAESTLLDTQFANRIGLRVAEPTTVKGSGGDVDAAFADGVAIVATGLALGPLKVGVLDLTDVGKRLVHGPAPIILGREYFDAARLLIDVDGGTVQRVTRTETPQGVKVPLTGTRGIEALPVSLEGHAPVAAAFDLGNGGAVLVGAAYARQWGLLSDGRPTTRKGGGGIGGEHQLTRLKLKSLELAGHVFHDVDAAIDETDSATPVNVGLPLLRQFVITTDYRARAVWLKWRQVPS
jgi:hypothetical protein